VVLKVEQRNGIQSVASRDLFCGEGCKALIYGQKLKKALKLPKEACLFTDRGIFLTRTSYFMGCIDARESIFTLC